MLGGGNRDVVVVVVVVVVVGMGSFFSLLVSLSFLTSWEEGFVCDACCVVGVAVVIVEGRVSGAAGEGWR